MEPQPLWQFYEIFYDIAAVCLRYVMLTYRPTKPMITDLTYDKLAIFFTFFNSKFGKR